MKTVKQWGTVALGLVFFVALIGGCAILKGIIFDKGTSKLPFVAQGFLQPEERQEVENYIKSVTGSLVSFNKTSTACASNQDQHCRTEALRKLYHALEFEPPATANRAKTLHHEIRYSVAQLLNVNERAEAGERTQALSDDVTAAVARFSAAYDAWVKAVT